MPQENNILISWKIPEHTRHQRGRLWYFLAFILGGFFIVYGVLTNNFLFALIIVIFAIIYGLLHLQEPNVIDFIIKSNGVQLGEEEITYKDIKSFWFVSRPEVKVKLLYFRTTSFLNPLFSVPLNDENPASIREALKKYIVEDLEADDEPTLEVVSRNLKL